ncbi:MAG: beta-ketoacyl-[Paludibacteraceae bacterium]|nr:beta-ketoacyl-[acyl-carrier-protein] synthase family protein [Paludibacteraceae bacterium]
MKRRVVVTGMGIWSCIGQDLQTVTESLRQGRSGIIFDPKRIEYGLQSGMVGKVPCPDLKPLLPRKFRATMSEEAEYAYMAARQAFEQAGIDNEYLKENEIGLIIGAENRANSICKHSEIMDIRENSMFLDPFSLFKEETSCCSMNLATIFNIKGINISISSACVSSSNALGIGYLLIKEGKQDMILAGGINFTNLAADATYDAIGGLSINNKNPLHASRPFDTLSDGAIFSEGAAMLFIEDYEHAISRNANILAEIIGFGTFSSAKTDVSHLDSDGMIISIKRALSDAKIAAADIDYVNAGALSAPYEDAQEAIALSYFFSKNKTMISSTESITGHEMAMAGASETIYSILMMINDFVAPNMNLVKKIDQAKDLNIVKDIQYTKLNVILNNSLGGGNSYSSLILRKV